MFEEISSPIPANFRNIMIRVFGILISIVRNTILITVAISKLQVLDPQKLFKQTVWKYFLFWLLAGILAGVLAFPATFTLWALLIQTWHFQGRWWLVLIVLLMRFYAIFFPITRGIFIYFFNKKLTFSETELTLEQREKISRHLAYFSFPHVILLPAAIIFFILLWF